MALNKNFGVGDKQAHEVLTAIQEIQSSNRFILKRLNQHFNEQNSHCSCTLLQERSQKEIAELKSKVTVLERVIEEKNELHRELSRLFGSLKDRLDLVETSLMALQTDDSKLRSASLRQKHVVFEQEQYSGDLVKHETTGDDSKKLLYMKSLERDTDSDQINPSSQVAQVNSVEYTIPVSIHDEDSKSESSESITVESEGAVGGLPLESSSPSRPNKNEAVLIEQSSELKTVISTSKPKTNTDTVQTKHNAKQKPVEVINDPIRKSYGSENEWRFLAKQELENGKLTLKELGGVHSVICLDISASMAEGKAWTEATAFLEDYLKGLDEVSTKFGLSNEHVAFVTFGHVSGVQKRFTNRYSEIQELVGKQKLGGPSPIYGGLTLALAAAGSSEHTAHRVNAFQVSTKIIIVTDGHPTEVGQYAGPDSSFGNLDETRAKILQCMEEYKHSHIDTFCVPVGNADKDFLELMVAVAEGRMLTHKSGNQLARRHYLATKIVDPLGLFTGSSELFLGTEFSADDRLIIEEIKSDVRKNIFTGRNDGQDKYREIPDENLAPIGSRVRRGPDWKWKTQDSYGPGTVIGHDDGGQVWVEWDTDSHRNVYRYGAPGYDVLIVEEPRELKPGQKIAVGCIVKPVTKGHYRQTGTVIKLNESKQKATVRWNDGQSGKYSYGGTGQMEIEVCAGFQPFSSQGYVLGSDLSTLPAEKKTKNKNKNIH